MSKIGQIRELVRNGLFYLTEHADDEAIEDGFDVYDIEYAIMTGKIQRTWPREGKYEIIGRSLDGRFLGVVCRITGGGKVRVITAYADLPKR